MTTTRQLVLQDGANCAICTCNVPGYLYWTFTDNSRNHLYPYFRIFNSKFYYLCSDECIAKFELCPILANPVENYTISSDNTYTPTIIGHNK